MREVKLDVNEQNFNLIWRGLAAREKELMALIEKRKDDDEDDEIAPCANNDLIYLRLYQNTLKESAKTAVFADSVFSLSDELIDLKDLI